MIDQWPIRKRWYHQLAVNWLQRGLMTSVYCMNFCRALKLHEHPTLYMLELQLVYWFPMRKKTPIQSTFSCTYHIKGIRICKFKLFIHFEANYLFNKAWSCRCYEAENKKNELNLNGDLEARIHPSCWCVISACMSPMFTFFWSSHTRTEDNDPPRRL